MAVAIRSGDRGFFDSRRPWLQEYATRDSPMPLSRTRRPANAHLGFGAWRRPGAGRLVLPAGALLLPLLLSAGSAVAAELDGSALVAGTATDNEGIESDRLEQRYSLGLSQQLTPYIGVRFGYQFLDITTTLQDGSDFRRRSRQPLLEMLYNRGRLSGRFAVFEQSIENTLQQESFDRRSLNANLSWQPAHWPGFALNYRRDTNVADVSVFGRDVGSQLFELTTFYNQKNWSANYSFQQIAVDNRSNELQTDQSRHEARGTARKGFWDQRLSLDVSGQLSRLNRTSRVGEDAELAEPLPAIAGLFAVDPTPEIGELEPNPTLIDGDIETPAVPPIDIGGANTLRNIGVDLGITRPATRLEIAVDDISGPQVVWLVFHSRDNLFWEPIPGVTSIFDGAILRYRLRFPETEDRFFKAVNVSVNPSPQVLVTEVRALLDLDASDANDQTRTTLYRGDVVASFHPTRRVSGAMGFGLSNDQSFSAGLVRRDFSEAHAFGRLAFDLAPGLDLNLGYRYNNSEDLREPVLLRTVNSFSASLGWVPLPTVDAVLSAGHRSETEEGDPLQSLQSVRLGVATLLLPDLRLVSDVNFSRLDDPFAGRDRDSWTWRETLEMRPIPTWSLGGGFTFSLNESRAGDPLLRRTQYRVFTTWTATSYLILGGTWWYTDDGGRTSLNQSYNVSYTPGNRLTLSATYQGFEGLGLVATSTDSLSLTYRLFARFVLFANLSQSKTEVSGGESARISNLRAGFRLAF